MIQGALLLPLLLVPARAAPAAWPYGVPSTDPYTDGFPSADERELFLWTNAVRVDPEAFTEFYLCSFESFGATEQSPHDPLFLDMGLAEAGRYHSLDMAATGNFSHSSSDGTDFATRVSWFYTDSGSVGENIAWNYPSNWSTVIEGWMCSAGHRANIMADYNELGTGVVDAYATQDFGVGTIQTRSPVAMGAHSPVDAVYEADFLADWLDPAPPSRLQVVVDGQRLDLALAYGTELRGVFAATVKLEALDCHDYWFAYETADGQSGAFPEAGVYTFGPGCTDGVGWVAAGGGNGGDGGIIIPGSDGDSEDVPDLADPRLVGCSSTPGRGGLLGLAWALGLAAGLRRRPR